MLPSIRIARAALLLLICTAAYADTMLVTGAVTGGFTSANCVDSPCPGWTTVSDGVWLYGAAEDPSYVAFDPSNNFSAWVDGRAVTIAQLQFYNSVNWGDSWLPEDDPTSAYTAALSLHFLFSNLGGQTADLLWNLNLKAVRYGRDTLFELPTDIDPIRIQAGANLYDFNLLGFYQCGTEVSEIRAYPWQWTAADLRASITSVPDTLAAPEPTSALLFLPVLGIAVFCLRRVRP